MVVSKQVQQPVQRQHAQFDGLAVPRLARLPACDSTRDDDIAQVPTSDLRPLTSDLRPLTSDFRPLTSDFRGAPSAVRLATSDLWPPTSDLRRKRQHVRGVVLLAVLPVEGAHARIIYHGHRHRAAGT